MTTTLEIVNAELDSVGRHLNFLQAGGALAHEIERVENHLAALGMLAVRLENASK